MKEEGGYFAKVSIYKNLISVLAKVGQKLICKILKTGWKISPDRAGQRGHGGSAWKLLNKQGKRIGTITNDGILVRD